MAGVSSATLQSWTMPALNAPQWDHTYVISLCGFVGPWGCHGRSAGGTMLISGTGSSAIADCLAQPNGFAGIRYGFTGVCHQMANRILHPAQITVDKCRGYAVSVFLYGDYGLGQWHQLNACYPSGTGLAGGSSPGDGPIAADATDPTGNALAGNTVYDAAVRGTAAAQEATQVATLAALAENALGHPLDGPTRRRLIAIQDALQAEQSKLIDLFDSGGLTPGEYLHQVNSALHRAMAENLRLLGKERFHAVFGEPGNSPDELIDRKTFMECSQRR